jgi:pyruvate kinase
MDDIEKMKTSISMAAGSRARATAVAGPVRAELVIPRTAPSQVPPENRAMTTACTDPRGVSSAAAVLLGDLAALRDELLAMEADGLARAGEIDPTHVPGARNLLHYIALRRRDLREVQERLADLGLSSLGRAERHVLANLESVLRLLVRLAGDDADARRFESALRAPDDGRARLDEHATALLGAKPARRSVRILVTLPPDAATDAALVRGLLEAGTDCVRINCAHDDADAWHRMIANVRLAERAVGRRCRILMDLGGPKLRTGSPAPGPCVVKWKPERDAFGRATAPARIRLRADGTERRTAGEPALPVTAAWLAALREGDRVSFRDARGAKREMRVVGRDADGAWAECDRTAYVVPGARLVNERGDASPREGAVGAIAPAPGTVRVRPGDLLEIVRPDAARADDGTPRIPCTLPEVFRDVRPGERVFIDDGRVGGVVRAANADRLVVEIDHARAAGDKLRADMGINFPDTDLALPALGDRDVADLEFVARHADAVSLSFVRDAEDVRVLNARLAELGADDLGVVLKIETRPAFERLPEILLAAMRRRNVGVMVARGDLAVECGWERLAEIQEEILWICEAAHVPAIWATQVLEGLAKDGRPTRAEITDAAMGVRAECVMLNKGPHVAEAVRTLDDILGRMEAHHHKKSSMLRPLRVARAFGHGGG